MNNNFPVLSKGELALAYIQDLKFEVRQMQGHINNINFLLQEVDKYVTIDKQCVSSI